MNEEENINVNYHGTEDFVNKSETASKIVKAMNDIKAIIDGCPEITNATIIVRSQKLEEEAEASEEADFPAGYMSARANLDTPMEYVAFLSDFMAHFAMVTAVEECEVNKQLQELLEEVEEEIKKKGGTENE